LLRSTILSNIPGYTLHESKMNVLKLELIYAWTYSVSVEFPFSKLRIVNRSFFRISSRTQDLLRNSEDVNETDVNWRMTRGLGKSGNVLNGPRNNYRSRATANKSNVSRPVIKGMSVCGIKIWGVKIAKYL